MSVQSGDNEALRDKADIVHHCYRDRSVTVNPIVEWTDRDVWDFLHHYGCAANPLYQCGEKRIGCIGCPLSGSKRQKDVEDSMDVWLDYCPYVVKKWKNKVLFDDEGGI